MILYLDRLSGWSQRMRRSMMRRPQIGPQPAE
jgi:hypothetical protein